MATVVCFLKCLFLGMKQVYCKCSDQTAHACMCSLIRAYAVRMSQNFIFFSDLANISPVALILKRIPVFSFSHHQSLVTLQIYHSRFVLF